MGSNITTGSFNEVISRERVIKDYTKNGKCSNCGGCCNDIIPLTNSDINRIKHYIKKNNIKPKIHNLLEINTIDTVCPFRDESNLKCAIYDVRPVVCRYFSCHNYYDALSNIPKEIKTTKPKSCYKTFYGE